MNDLKLPSLCFNCRRKLWPDAANRRTREYVVGVVRGIALILVLAAALQL